MRCCFEVVKKAHRHTHTYLFSYNTQTHTNQSLEVSPALTHRTIGGSGQLRSSLSKQIRAILQPHQASELSTSSAIPTGTQRKTDVKKEKARELERTEEEQQEKTEKERDTLIWCG